MFQVHAQALQIENALSHIITHRLSQQQRMQNLAYL